MKLIFILFLSIAAMPIHAAEIRVAAASDLNFAIKEMIVEFEKQTGHKVLLTLGSSGNFFAQISKGAPFDVFLSADVDYTRKLESAGYALPGSVFIYGVGRIALWASKVDVTRGMNVLAESSTKKIAIANPQHAPYGRAAVAAMQHANVYPAAKDKLVLGENISQAAQFVQSGAADVGIIALSLALAEPMTRAGKHWLIPVNSYPEMEQAAVLTKRAGPAAREFHAWLGSPAARKILQRYGFALQ